MALIHSYVLLDTITVPFKLLFAASSLIKSQHNAQPSIKSKGKPTPVNLPFIMEYIVCWRSATPP